MQLGYFTMIYWKGAIGYFTVLKFTLWIPMVCCLLLWAKQLDKDLLTIGVIIKVRFWGSVDTSKPQVLLEVSPVNDPNY